MQASSACNVEGARCLGKFARMSDDDDAMSGAHDSRLLFIQRYIRHLFSPKLFKDK